MNHFLWEFWSVPCQYVHLQTYIENNLDFEIKDFIQLTCIMPILLNIYILNAYQGLPDTILEEDHSMTIPPKVGSN
jgi:hypothetical protein